MDDKKALVYFGLGVLHALLIVGGIVLATFVSTWWLLLTLVGIILGTILVVKMRIDGGGIA
jgi:hypothetical protein